MMKKALPRLIVVTLIALILSSVMNTVAAGNSVPATRLADRRFSITPSDLAPAACTGMSLTNIVNTTGFLGIMWGTNGNDLILGGNGGDVILALNGDDCILGGGGGDSIYAGDGTDVCIGGPGNDSFNQCEAQTQ
jgi:Ca2+-binding RTX toxin-like protein